MQLGMEIWKTLSLMPRREGAKPIIARIPSSVNSAQRQEFEGQITEAVRNGCGSLACNPRVVLHPLVSMEFLSRDTDDESASEAIEGVNQVDINRAVLRCNNDCPYADPGGGESGDREPLVPSPNAPSMRQEFESDDVDPVSLGTGA